MASGSLDYMLNLTNLMTGYDPERKYDVQLFAGIVASMRMKHENRFFIGGEAGLQTSYRVGRRFKVFLEPKIRIYGKELLMQDNVQERHHDVAKCRNKLFVLNGNSYFRSSSIFLTKAENSSGL